MDNNNFKNYNPSNRGDAFNENYGRKNLSRNCNDVTSEQKQQAAQRLQDLIQRCQSDLFEDNL